MDRRIMSHNWKKYLRIRAVRGIHLMISLKMVIKLIQSVKFQRSKRLYIQVERPRGMRWDHPSQTTRLWSRQVKTICSLVILRFTKCVKNRDKILNIKGRSQSSSGIPCHQDFQSNWQSLRNQVQAEATRIIIGVINHIRINQVSVLMST